MRVRTPAAAASHLWTALVTAVGLFLPGAIQGADPEPAPDCALLNPGADSATSASCRSCHLLPRVHPVDLDYGVVAARDPGRYVPGAEVVRAGLLLPYGELRCVTCHDGESPWRYRLVLPAGTVAIVYRPPGGFPRTPASSTPASPGDDVDSTPLCRACHRIGGGP